MTGASGDLEWTGHFRNLSPVSRVIAAEEAAVWVALPAVFSELGYEAQETSVDGRRVYATERMHVRGELYDGVRTSAFLNCGLTVTGRSAADEYDVTFAILARTSVEPTGGTMVGILIDGYAAHPSRRSDRVFCTGTGKLEQEMLRMVEARTSGGL